MRECGECTLCCTVTRVPELNKPENVLCSNCDKGCTIYNNRPQSCRTFECEWLKGNLSNDMRPDKSHVMLEKLLDVPVVLLLQEPGSKIELTKITKELKETYVNNGIAVVAAANRKVLIPEGYSTEEIFEDIKNSARKMGVI